MKYLLSILLLIDCLLNWFPCMGSFNQTLSARAHYMREKAEREQRYGGAWAALRTLA